MPNGQLVEYYLPVKEVEEVKDENHRLFEKWRDKDPETMTPKEGDEWSDDQDTSCASYQSAWEAYLVRTSQTELIVEQILAKLQHRSDGLQLFIQHFMGFIKDAFGFLFVFYRN
jgi:hypothetical protein